jgi:hypothetical protein
MALSKKAKTTLSFDADDIDLLIDALEAFHADVTNEEDISLLMYNLGRFHDAHTRLRRLTTA